MAETSDGGPLGPGARIVIRDSRGNSVELEVRGLERGSLQVAARDLRLDPGELVMVEHRVVGHGCFRARAEIGRRPGGEQLIHPIEGFRRDNERAFVRVRTYGIDVVLSNPLAILAESPEDLAVAARDPFPMLDVSAGGALIQADPDFEVGEEVVCHFELPGECCFALPAGVVRVIPSVPGVEKGEIAVEFSELDESLRSALLRWIYREQVSRPRDR